VGFFIVDTIWLHEVYVLFFIDVASRRVHLARCTAHPDAACVTQQAQQVAWTLAERTEPVRFLIRDRDRKFTAAFDAVFEAEHIRVGRMPIQAPQANGIAERFVRTVRTERLDWLLILNARHWERTLAVFIDHYNRRRPHRGLGLAPPKWADTNREVVEDGTDDVSRRDRPGGFLHEYERAP
jgi:transposase InsO family protein